MMLSFHQNNRTTEDRKQKSKAHPATAPTRWGPVTYYVSQGQEWLTALNKSIGKKPNGQN